MARKTTRRKGRKTSTARRSYSGGRRRSFNARSRASRPQSQTVRIVVEQSPAQQSGPDAMIQQALGQARRPKKSRF